jgi:hypothetical protein
MNHNPALEQLLHQGELKPLIEQALKIQQINRALQPFLPEAFQGKVQVSTIKSGSVVLDLPNASMLTVLQYQGPELLSKLRQIPGLAGLASVKFRVTPPKAEIIVEEALVEPKRISVETAELLRSMAEKLEDEGLKTALLSLASRV